MSFVTPPTPETAPSDPLLATRRLVQVIVNFQEFPSFGPRPTQQQSRRADRQPATGDNRTASTATGDNL